MSKNEELIDALRSKSGPLPWGPDLFARAADHIEAQDARIEALEAAVDTWTEMAARRHRALGEAEQERDNLRIELGLMENDRDACVAVISEALASLETAGIHDAYNILSAVPSAVLSAYTTRIREEALGEIEWEYGEQSRYHKDTVWRVIADSDTWAEVPTDRRVRRRKAGPWEPVPGGDSNAQ